MVDNYCSRHGGGSASPRSDGLWSCDKLLGSRVVNAGDMNVVCSDTYGSGAYAQSSNSGDPYAWRCYRL